MISRSLPSPAGTASTTSLDAAPSPVPALTFHGQLQREHGACLGIDDVLEIDQPPAVLGQPDEVAVRQLVLARISLVGRR